MLWAGRGFHLQKTSQGRVAFIMAGKNQNLTSASQITRGNFPNELVAKSTTNVVKTKAPITLDLAACDFVF